MEKNRRRGRREGMSTATDAIIWTVKQTRYVEAAVPVSPEILHQTKTKGFNNQSNLIYIHCRSIIIRPGNIPMRFSRLICRVGDMSMVPMQLLNIFRLVNRENYSTNHLISHHQIKQ